MRRALRWLFNLAAAGSLLACVALSALRRVRRGHERGAFPDWVRQRLAPALRPGDTVVLDNLSSHKVSGVREAIEAAGASLRYLPTYSPDFDPIEKAFSQVKRHIRRLKLRDGESLWQALGRLPEVVTPQQACNYIASCGYTISQAAVAA